MVLFIFPLSLLDIFWQVFISTKMYKERHRLERMVKTTIKYLTPSSNLGRKLCVMLLLHPPMVSTLVYSIRFKFCSLSTQLEVPFDQYLRGYTSIMKPFYGNHVKVLDTVKCLDPLTENENQRHSDCRLCGGTEEITVQLAQGYIEGDI